jgi:hypothetical protein
MASIVAKIVSNQPICAALLREASKHNNSQQKKAYETAALEVSNADVDLTNDLYDISSWIKCLDNSAGNFVEAFVELYHIKKGINNDEPPKTLFPPEWRGYITEEEFIIALSVSPAERNRENCYDTTMIKEANHYYYNTIKHDSTREWIFRQLNQYVEWM